MKTNRAEIVYWLHRINTSKRAVSEMHWWGWLNPYVVTIDGDAPRCEVCNRLYRENLVETAKQRGHKRYLRLSPQGDAFLKKHRALLKRFRKDTAPLSGRSAG